MTPPIASALESAVLAPFVRSGLTVVPSIATRGPRHLAAVIDSAAALPALIEGALQHRTEWLSLHCDADTIGVTEFLRKHGTAFAARGVAFHALNNQPASIEDSAALNAVAALREPATSVRLTVTLAFAFCTRHDLAQAAARANKEDLGAAEFQKHMAAAVLPPVDLFLYAGGKAQLSSFLLWHAAYAELSFISMAWNRFALEDMRAVAADYAARSRTFGALKK